MTHLSLAVILLSILAFTVGFIFGVVLSSEDKYHIPRTNFDKYIQVNRNELIQDLASQHCINPITYKHEQLSCENCPFEHDSHMIEYCISNTEEWLRQPYID